MPEMVDAADVSRPNERLSRWFYDIGNRHRRCPLRYREAGIDGLPSSRAHYDRGRMEQSASHPRRKQIRQADAPEQFRPDAVGHTIDDLRAVLRRVDMSAKRPFAERHVDDRDDRRGDRTDIGIGRFEQSEAF